MKKLSVLAGLLLTGPLLAKIDLDPAHRLKLEHPVLVKLDGLRLGINGERIRRMLTMIAIIRALQYGAYNKELQRHEGLFHWHDQKVTIHDLAQLEKTDLMIEDRHQLERMLYKAREQFIEKTRKNSEESAPIKKFLLRLIHEFCEKRQIQSSFLQTWADVPLEEEASNFHKGITSFSALDQFFADLTTFMKDLIYSCPKAFEQFNQEYGNRTHFDQLFRDDHLTQRHDPTYAAGKA
ncbi:MAG TPA: hypothetical protein VJJ83_03485 [Candidatus Babeliales bacterium]|nr:hypothetical protein [Candidatus Babeliales bacterium]